ncbi:unnamed protein product [Adineta ricciae]|uniref:Uncharacterized protein n=1 Tax=Adineta ricciae TaxID=249248 RepID=A0A815U953_ADIRI|nr:unnamed protein product [Adineta ricciae]CAF1513662.1 unnamed protein product [Adineta ricciae]
MQKLFTNLTNPKGTLFNEIKTKIEKIPNYLTKHNELLKQMIHEIISTMKIVSTADNMDDLRKISIEMHKIMIIQTYQLLWMTYLKSSTGQLLIDSIMQTELIWPKEIKTMVQTIQTGGKSVIRHETYLEFVNSYLNALENYLKKYKLELNCQINNFQYYSLGIKQHIEKYLEKQLESFRMEIEHKVELVHYDYQIRALKVDYFRHNPNDQQKQIIERMCRDKYEQKITEEEYKFLQQQIAYYNSPSQSFESSPLAHCPLTDSIENPTIRQNLFKQYKEVAEQSRTEMFNLYLKTAEDQRMTCKYKYDTSMKELWSNQHHHSAVDQNNVLSKIMIDLIDERCTKIGERIQCIYQFKATQFIQSNSKL